MEQQLKVPTMAEFMAKGETLPLLALLIVAPCHFISKSQLTVMDAVLRFAAVLKVPPHE